MRDTVHFSDMLRERGIRPQWADSAVTEPDRVEDRVDATRHFLKRIPEFGDRWPRVIIDPQQDPPARVTAFFDRRLRRTER